MRPAKLLIIVSRLTVAAAVVLLICEEPSVGPKDARADETSVVDRRAAEGRQPPSASEPVRMTTFDIAGIVVNSEKQPLADAEVRVYETYTGAEMLHAETRTDRDGRFAFRDIPQDKEGLWRYTLTASAASFASRVVFVPHAPSEQVEYQLELAAPQTLRGRVVDPSGQPVSGADVWTPPLKEPVPGVYSATTDINGYFQIDDLEPWNSAEEEYAREVAGDDGWRGVKYHLRVRHHAFGMRLVPYAQVPTSVFVRFEPPMIVQGRVVDRETGDPAAGVRVSAGYVDTLSDRNGRYVLVVQPLEDITVTVSDGQEQIRSAALKGAPATTFELPDLVLRVKKPGAAREVTAASSVDSLSSLRQEYASFERRASQLAVQLRTAELGSGTDRRGMEELKAELRLQIAGAFAARQRVQRAELAAIRERLAAIERQIESREGIKDRIIEHRLEELLNPALRWELDVPPGGEDTVDAGSGEAVPAVSSLPAEIEKVGSDTESEPGVQAPGELEGPPREASKQPRSTPANLHQLGIAFQNYHDAYRRFPPAVITHKGPRKLKHPYSWRVEILPFVEAMQLYDQYNFEEPWDSQHNLEILQQMPPVFRHPEAAADSTSAAYFALVGPGTVFEGSDGIPMRNVSDGTTNTMLLVEARRGIPWTKPEDIPYVPGEKPVLGGYQKNGFHALFCDGAVRFIPESIDARILRLLIDPGDGETIPVDGFPERVEAHTNHSATDARDSRGSGLRPDALDQSSSFDQDAVLDWLCQQAYSRATALRSLQYSFEYKSKGSLHAEVEFYADEKRFRVNRRDLGEPFASFASAFDGQQYQYREEQPGRDPRLRLKSGNEDAGYSISTPQTMMFSWLRLPRDTAFRWDCLFDRNRWQRRFDAAVYAGRVREGRRLFEVVEFPQRDVRTPCIYRVFFAPELGYLPMKYERRVEATGERASWLEVVQYQTFDVDGRRIAVPTEVEYTGTHADGVSVDMELTMTVAEGTLKVNEVLDERLFTVSREGVKGSD